MFVIHKCKNGFSPLRTTNNNKKYNVYTGFLSTSFERLQLESRYTKFAPTLQNNYHFKSSVTVLTNIEFIGISEFYHETNKNV